MKYDCLIIGAGMSGLAAGIRLAHFGKKVAIYERHHQPGGLNSYYSRGGFELETGLHGMTNFARRDARKSLPLLKLLRQLRIPYESLMPREQNFSLIKFPGHTLKLSNDFSELENSVAEQFPRQIDHFRRLDEAVMLFDELNLDNQFASARQFINRFISDPGLVDMLFCPLMFYGSALPDDMDISQFVIMYKSIFKEGFFRPAGNGIKMLLDILQQRFLESGGTLHLGCGIKQLITDQNSVTTVITDNDDRLQAGQILSSAGHIETLQLCQPSPKKLADIQPGELGYLETVIIPGTAEILAKRQETIIFYSTREQFNYRPPAELFDSSSGVICFPHNFQFTAQDQAPKTMLRATVLANSQQWLKLAGKREQYQQQKNSAVATIAEQVANLIALPPLLPDAKLIDAFTPQTILRYTGHINGAIYGSPEKVRNGQTDYNNLFLCGTDQGFLGITGAMLSGISIANRYLLR